MKESNKPKLESIKLVYNEVAKRIIAELTISVVGEKIENRTIDRIGTIEELLNVFAKQTKKPVSELISRGLISIDDVLLTGVLVNDPASKDEPYKKYTFNKDTGTFEKANRLSRNDQKSLGRNYLREETSDKTGEDKNEDEPVVIVSEKPAEDETKEIPIVVARRKEPDEDIKEDEPAKETSIIKDKRNGNRRALYEIAGIIQRLNPEADIRVGRLEDPEVSYRFFSSIPVEKLLLPVEFHLESDNYGWITDNIESVRFLIRDLALADERMLGPSLRDYVFPKKHSDSTSSDAEVEDKKKDEEKKASSDDKKDVSTEEKKNNGVHNVRINGKALAALGLAVVILAGSVLYGRSKSTKDEPAEIVTPIENMTSGDEFIGGDESTIYVNSRESYGEGTVVQPISSELYDHYDLDTRINMVEDMCVPFRSCDFYNLVNEYDRATIKTINEARNEAIIDNSRLDSLVDDYVKYVLEGTTMFNGEVVKGYDYLDPFSKYVVIISGETILQLCHDYNYSYGNGMPNFSRYVNDFDEKLNETYAEMLSRVKTF